MGANTTKWKDSFDSEKHLRAYDDTANLFSLRRTERLKVLKTLLPKTSDSNYKILELGTGTGVVSELLVKHYPKATVVAVDGAKKMLEQAKLKKLLQKNKQRIQWILADYSCPLWLKDVTTSFDLIVTVDSLHHLTHERKKELYQEIYDLMLQGGCFIISDHITSNKKPYYDESQYGLWMQEVLDKLKGVEEGSDIALTIENTFSWTHKDLQKLSIPRLQKAVMEDLRQEKENPMALMQHIDVMRDIGFGNVVVEYRYANFAIISAKK